MRPLPFLLTLAAALLPCVLRAITPAELEARFKPLPTVPEAEIPSLPNEPGPFRGRIRQEGLEGRTWVTFPFLENPGSFAFDPQGRLYVAEANRFWLGVPDLRGANELIRDDFRAKTVADRLAMYQSHAANFPEGWFERVADRVILLEDRDGNGAPDRRSVFSDRFRRPEDGIGFSLLADDGSVYFTCIPSVWRLRDTDGDGKADEETEISTGYGVRVSFIGHDLHGIVRGPDGRLYFSVGDRGYHLTTADERTREGSGRGAIFRCESDGSGLEVFCTGLRNPQELAFDDHGNLFTFDNTGDIGDKARMVYALEGSDSGWDMAHQSAHHYATHLDWGDFRPEKSMWVAERMFDLWNEEQPQWVYPPASHVAQGPSGTTWLTGESLPDGLRGKFLLANYRGPSENCTVLLVGHEPKGAGYVASSEEVLVEGVGASDVELGYDGRIYLCDFGGGWSVNENGSIQVLSATDDHQRKAGEEVARLFREGFAELEIGELASLVAHPDRRVRQAAQFALVDRGEAGRAALEALAGTKGETLPRLHAIWGLGQIGRRGAGVGEALLSTLEDEDAEVRANAARVLGDLRLAEAKDPLLERLATDRSIRVRSLAAIALGRISGEDPGVAEALFGVGTANSQAGWNDPVLRHAVLSGLDLACSEEKAAMRSNSTAPEDRLLALLVLRRKGSPETARFLDDEDALVRREAVRAVYDTAALDSEAGERLAALGSRATDLPETLQRRVVAANYRRGTPRHALALLEIAGDEAFAKSVRKAALQGLKLWGAAIDTDPVLGHYRPQAVTEGRGLADLAPALSDPLRRFLQSAADPELTALALELATLAGVQLDPATLLSQAGNAALSPGLRVAAIESLAASKPEGAEQGIAALLDDESAPVAAAAMRAAFVLGLDGIAERARRAVPEAPLPVARAALAGLATAEPDRVAAFWKERQPGLRPGLWLDAYLALFEAGHPEAAAYAASDPQAVFRLGLHGGDPAAGEFVFKNHGACLQCHKVGGPGGEAGGVQGPDLRQVAKRLPREKILESVADPNAEISPGYGMTTVQLQGGESVIGRLAEETPERLVVVGLDQTRREIPRAEITSIAPPVSAMPPMAAALPPRDFRDLIAFLASQYGGKAGGKGAKGDASHGDDEKIAK